MRPDVDLPGRSPLAVEVAPAAGRSPESLRDADQERCHWMWGSPEWLNDPYLQIEYMTPFWNQMVVRYAPGVDAPTGELVRLTGHFDDPASATCLGGYEDVATGQQVEIPAELQVLGCRMRFVVTEWAEP